MSLNGFDFPQNLWVMWILLALIAALLEVTLPAFAFLFASLAAGITALGSLFLSWPMQIVVFLFSVLLMVLLLRPRFLNRLQKEHSMPSRSEALVGLVGVVTESVDPQTGSGRVMVEGQDWSARSLSPIPVGKSVKVENHDGIVLIIKEI